MANLYLNLLSAFKTVCIFFKNTKTRSNHGLTEAVQQKSNMSRHPTNSHKGFESGNSKFSNKYKGGTVYQHPDLTNVVEIIKHKFYFATRNPGVKIPKRAPDLYLFNIDDELIYNNFYNDFGPLNIGCLYKYCQGVHLLLKSPKHQKEQIVHYTSPNENKRANAAYLVAAFIVLFLDKSPGEAYRIINNNKGAPPLKPFQDASVCSQYTIELIDCLKAISKASSLGFFNFDDFDLKEFEKCEHFKNGDLSWIVPYKFIAFLGPSTEPGSLVHYPEKYINYFLKNDVVAVIRLNRRTYDQCRFTDCGIMHYDMFFPDGTVPPRRILKQFLHIAENTRGAIAIHCKAGLGRTGTLIAAYLMKHYCMTAKEAIAWLRICRPGSVIGQQQTFLQDMEGSLWRDGFRYRQKNFVDPNKIPHHKRGIYSIASKWDRKSRSREFSRTGNRSWSANKYNRNQYDTMSVQSSSNNPTTQGDKLNKIKMTRRESQSIGSLASYVMREKLHHNNY